MKPSALSISSKSYTMKNSISLACLLLLATTAFSQKNMLKAHLGGLPTNTLVYSFGVGYERMVADNWTVQLMFNNYGWSQGKFDGQSEFSQNTVLETRRYLGEKENAIPKKAIFIGCFAEAFRTKVLPGGEWSEPPPPLDGKRWGMGTGLVLGAHLPIFKNFTLEFFAGPKFRYVKSVDYIGTASDYNSYNSHSYTKIRPRIGCNIGYRF